MRVVLSVCTGEPGLLHLCEFIEVPRALSPYATPTRSPVLTRGHAATRTASSTSSALRSCTCSVRAPTRSPLSATTGTDNACLGSRRTWPAHLAARALHPAHLQPHHPRKRHRSSRPAPLLSCAYYPRPALTTQQHDATRVGTEKHTELWYSVLKTISTSRVVQVRAAAVTSLAKFGAVVPSLRPNIIVLLRRCVHDADDEVSVLRG